MNTRAKRWIAAGLVLAFSLWALSLMHGSGWLQIVELKAYDLHTRALPPRISQDIVLLAIDQASLEEYSDPLPLWHRYYAQAIEAAASAGARVIGVDVAFGIPVERWAPGLDGAMAEAFVTARKRTQIVCASAAPLSSRQQQWPVPWNMLCAAGEALAYVNLTADADDFIRRFEVWDADARQPSFAWAIAHAYRPGLPPPPARMIRIRHAGPAGSIPRVSLVRFLQAAARGDQRQLSSWVGGKIVLLGPDLITDRHATPHYAFRAGSPANTSGVEIHGSSIATLLSRDYLLDLAPNRSWLVLGLAVTILAVASIFASSLPFAVAWLGTPLVLTALAHYLFRNGSVAPTALWLAAWLTTFLAGLAARSLLAERRGHLFRHAVSVFVGESVARHMDVAGRMHLDSRREEVTVLFTDIEGFTAFSESREPEVVLQSLNLYFEQLNEIVQRHGGQVNKLIGDGMLALFAERPAEPGQPPPEPHALRATRAAIEIAKTESGFRTRAGLHTGMVVVGNVGSGVKLEYTALGDTVNVASRLEALNKERHTRILLSGATRDGIGNAIALLPAGEVAVRGKTTGLPVYTTEWPLE